MSEIREATARENREGALFYEATLSAAITTGAEMGHAPLSTLLGLMQASAAMMAEIDRKLAADCLRTHADCLRFPPGSPGYAAGKRDFLKAATRLAQRTVALAETMAAGGGGRVQ